MTSRRFAAALAGIALAAIVLRGLFPAADPPWRTTVGVVWHDEGAWVHNARSKALFGAWRLDEWNPVFIAPVFTGLEYLSFAAFGVGVRQARLVSEAAGLASVILLALGVRRLGGDRAGLIAGALLATNYVYVMYDRAAIMEALMASFIVASWYCSTRAARQPAWGAAAGLMATLAFFTKAAAAFYVGALGLAAVIRLVETWNAGAGRSDALELPSADGSLRNSQAIAWWTLGGLALSFAIVIAAFVLPHWTDYRFYNWQMSVERKPSYDVKSLLVRVSWFPILHDTFTRMWTVLCLAVVGAWGIAARWRRAPDGERLLLLWVTVGSLEMLIHDVGNERRYVFLIPAAVALASLVLARGTLLPIEAAAIPRRRLLEWSPLLAFSAYIVCGPLARLPFLYDVRMPARIGAIGALLLTIGIIAAWPRVGRAAAAQAWRPGIAVLVTVLLAGGDLMQFWQWARARSYKNYAASVALGRVLPPGTLVQGKLANGLALENRIRPLFIGHEFGNYADRGRREDVRYILTYIVPSVGYEGSQIRDVLESYPGWRIIMKFDVAETHGGHDTAALIEKRARH
jgi:4-amino-4-deoxy-L-arabinose transferase-like glycosyltransferase